MNANVHKRNDFLSISPYVQIGLSLTMHQLSTEFQCSDWEVSRTPL